MSYDILETFENPKMSRDYSINFEIPEFTSLCPKTGQPDFANIVIEYIPDKLCVELKSLKIYFVSFRDKPGFHEDLTNQILDDLVKLLDKWPAVTKIRNNAMKLLKPHLEVKW